MKTAQNWNTRTYG